MVQTSFCPRGAFCAFAHVERKYKVFLCHIQLITCRMQYWLSFYVGMANQNIWFG